MQMDFLMYLQKISNPVLDNIFIFLTNLGSETFYILVITFIYWCVNKHLGIRLFVVTMATALSNSFLKDLFHTQRPIFEENIKSIYVESAPGYSFPSGHTQISTSFWCYLMTKIKEKTIYVIGSIIIILVAFSRLYLRVHWPIDVIGGLFFGIIIALLSHHIINKISSFKFNYTFAVILSIIIPSFLLLIYPTETNVKMLALTTGGFIGYFSDKKLLNFSVSNSLFKQIIKYSIGIIVLLGIKTVLKSILPSSVIFQYIRYLIMGIWITFLSPLLFIKLKIANSHN
ncbi:phosphatase PAP2 family protein [Sporosalibacterium faouarense]|uniref:phosphatase PAP2 family protein n=1 Tax=Sporosalibacterium faouarense TaxID=516123 RepID=UPI00141C9449|nr:phosphatase PAP2 family protein [Sporosalibacterium faouarense]MTI49210.1 phosphatase PAP2 family protein [Bacillota bacterium]